jgi:hypothetical protein
MTVKDSFDKFLANFLITLQKIREAFRKEILLRRKVLFSPERE